jgi:hypothetical protein
MSTYQLPMPKRRKYLSATVFGTAAITLAVGGLAQPAVTHAEAVWDIGAYDSCVKAANKRFEGSKTNYDTWQDELKFCCQMSGGELSPNVWSPSNCTAPPMTAQSAPQTRWDVGWAPQPAPATQAPNAPQPPAAPPTDMGYLP